MPILENDHFHEDDWHFVDNDDAPFSGNIIVPSQKIAAASGRNTPGRTGVYLAPDDSIDPIRPYLSKLDLVCLDFPAFNDGRAFSQARYLREICQFKGIIRVRGHYLPDQYEFLRRCGVDQITIESEDMKKQWEHIPQFFSVAYQPSTRQEKEVGPLFRRLLKTKK